MKTAKAAKPVILFGPWPPPYGGVAVHIRSLFGCLEKSMPGLSVLGHGDFEPSPKIAKFTWEGFDLSVSETESLFYRCMKENVPARAVLHDHTHMLAYPEAVSRILETQQLRKAKKLKWVWTLHDETIVRRYNFYSVSTRNFFQDAVSSLDRIICVSESLKTFLRDAGIREKSVEVISPLLPLDAEEPPALPPGAAAFFGEHSPVITAAGVFTPLYDFATIAEAFVALKKERPGAGLALLDGGFAREDEYMSGVLGSLAGVSGSVLRLERLERPSALALFAASDVMVRGAERESFGLSKIEAIMMGTPVVATPAGETRHTATYKFGDSRDLAEKIRAALDEPQNLDEAARFYNNMAADNLERIAGIYLSL